MATPEGNFYSTDAAIARLVERGDTAEMRRKLIGRGLSPEDADDAIQIALIGALNSAREGRFDPSDTKHLKNSVNRSAINAGISTLRKAQTVEKKLGKRIPMEVKSDEGYTHPIDVIDTNPEIENFPERIAMRVALLDALQGLPVRRRTIFLLHTLYELPFREIGELVGIDHTKVWKDFKADLATLQTTLETSGTGTAVR